MKSTKIRPTGIINQLKSKIVRLLNCSVRQETTKLFKGFMLTQCLTLSKKANVT